MTVCSGMVDSGDALVRACALMASTDPTGQVSRSGSECCPVGRSLVREPRSSADWATPLTRRRYKDAEAGAKSGNRPANTVVIYLRRDGRYRAARLVPTGDGVMIQVEGNCTGGIPMKKVILLAIVLSALLARGPPRSTKTFPWKISPLRNGLSAKAIDATAPLQAAPMGVS
jgi:hypothetical protein